MFSDGTSENVEIETMAELSYLTVDDFSLRDFAGLGMIACGSGIVISLLVLGLISIIRTR